MSSTEPRDVQLGYIYKASDPFAGHRSDFIEGALDAIDGYAAEQYPLYSEPLTHEAYHAGYAFGQSLKSGVAA